MGKSSAHHCPKYPYSVSCITIKKQTLKCASQIIHHQTAVQVKRQDPVLRICCFNQYPETKCMKPQSICVLIRQGKPLDTMVKSAPPVVDIPASLMSTIKSGQKRKLDPCLCFCCCNSSMYSSPCSINISIWSMILA